MGRRRCAMPSLIPRPLSRIEMRESVAHRFEAAAQVTRQLLGCELIGSIEGPMERPVVEINKGLQVLKSHSDRVQSKAAVNKSRCASELVGLRPSRSAESTF